MNEYSPHQLCPPHRPNGKHPRAGIPALPSPIIYGRPRDGSMEQHEPGRPSHYDLHVWLWKANPSGIFAPFNPNASCQ